MQYLLANICAQSPSFTTSSSSSSSSEREYDDEETSSSGSSTANSRSDSEPERLPATSSVQLMHSDISSQSSSSSTNSDSEVEKPSGTNETGVVVTKGSPAHVEFTSTSQETDTQANVQQKQGSSLPYEGTNHTRKRNQRRRDSKRMKRLKSMGALPDNATFEDLRRLNGDENRIKGASSVLREDSQVNVTKLGADLELRRDALLEAISSGGVDVSPKLGLENASPSVNITEASSKFHAAITENIENQIDDNQSELMQDVEQTANREPDATPAVTEAPSLRDEISLESSKRRSKLDLPSSRRLLFGSLGLPTPKNKQDELNIRKKLMKDVKLRKPSESQIEVEVEMPLTVGQHEENEQWKDKIVLRAVECCYDGIELSTPPFPFVQRWDPQQQGGYEGLQKGRDSRKSKKRKRNDGQFCQPGPKHISGDWAANANTVAAEIEEPLHDDFVPSRIEQQQQRQQQQQLAPKRENDEYEVAIIDQLMRETDASASASAENGSVQDLPTLPGDMSRCTPLTKEASLPGAIVAFKQLDMSQETNWQPKVSDYRTALVERFMENGIVRMNLAQRDQPKVQKSYDQQTGERIYSKFEMPGFNDDIEKGTVELSFAELIEPKLIRVGIIEPLGMDNQQFSTRVDGLPSEFVTGGSTDTNLKNCNSASPKLPYGPTSGSESDRGREEVRQDIFDIIKDAGWRSSIRSNMDQQSGSKDILSPSDQAEDRGQELVDPISPKFLGFSSSPLRGGRIEAISEFSNTAEFMSDPISQPADIAEVAESLPFQRITGPESPLKDLPYSGDEDLDIKAEDEDANPAGNEPQSKSGLQEAAHQASSQQLDSPKFPCQSVPSNTRGLQHDPPAKESISTDDTDSDEFPMVEDIFSQVRSSYEPSSVAMEDSTYSSFETSISKNEPISSPETWKMQPEGKENISEKQTVFKWAEPESGADRSRSQASQVSVQSEVIDLTLSSDPADAADSDYVDYGTQLPSGPGWVRKKQTSGRRFSTAEPSSRRSRQTRSTSYRAFG